MNYRDWLEQQADRRLDEASFAAARGQEMQAKAGRQARTAFLHAAAKFDSAPSAIAREIIEANPNLGADMETLVNRGIVPIDKGEVPDFDAAIDSFAGKVLLQYLARRNTYSSTFGAPSLAVETECMRRAILAVLTP